MRPAILTGSAIALFATLAWSGAEAQQGSIVGTWGVGVQGKNVRISITLQLLPTGQFQQDMQNGNTACMHSIAAGDYGLVQQPDVYRFNITRQEPRTDCSGNPITAQAGWTAQLQLVDGDTLNWHDEETGNSVRFHRLQ
jgi:hypothetical protein